MIDRDSILSLAPYDLRALLKTVASYPENEFFVYDTIIRGDPEVAQMGAVDVKIGLRRCGKESQIIQSVLDACLKSGIIPKNFCAAYRHEPSVSRELAEAFVKMIDVACEVSQLRGCVVIFSWEPAAGETVSDAQRLAIRVVRRLNPIKFPLPLRRSFDYIFSRMKELHL